GRTADGAAIIRELAGAKGGSLKVVAEVFEEVGDFVAADEFYRAHAAKTDRADNVLARVKFLIRRGKCSEALDLSDRCWSTCAPLSVAQACLLALCKTTPTAEQFGSVSARLEAAIAAAPDQ